MTEQTTGPVPQHVTEHVIKHRTRRPHGALPRTTLTLGTPAPRASLWTGALA